GSTDRDLWTHYAQVLGKQDAVHLLNEFFKDRLISEWDEIFYTDIAPLVFRRIVEDLRLTKFNADFTSEVTYTGGERVITLFVSGDTSLKRNQLPQELQLLLTARLSRRSRRTSRSMSRTCGSSTRLRITTACFTAAPPASM